MNWKLQTESSSSLMPDTKAEHDEEAACLMEPDRTSTACSRQRTHGYLLSNRSAFPWIISTWIFAIIAATSLGWNYFTGAFSYTSVLSSDLLDARRVIEYEQRAYTGALVYDQQKKIVHRLMDADTQYFGRPSSELDAAWSDLMRGEFPIMTPEEAAPFVPELKPFPTDGQFHFEPDMFHSLHCMNAIRLEVSKSLYPDVDPSKLEHKHGGSSRVDAQIAAITSSQEWREAHLEHCMDRVMQSIMCHGDLTPSPLYLWRGFPITLGRTKEHTCRKFTPIRTWMDERNYNGTAVEGL